MSVLYVVFHGEIVFFDSCNPKDCIHAYAPEMGIHVYSAGPWLAENLIPKGLKLKLDGVNSGAKTLKDYSDRMVVFNHAVPDTDKINSDTNHMQIELPRPENIFSGGRIELAKDAIQVTPPQSFTPTSDNYAPLCSVFQYTILPECRPALKFQGTFGQTNTMCPEKLEWQSAESQDGSYVLHVFAEADIVPGDEHIQEASRLGASLIGVNLTVTVGGGARKPADQVPIGVFPDEVILTLSDRLPYLGDLNDQLHRQGGNNLRWGLSERHGGLQRIMGVRQCATAGGVA